MKWTPRQILAAHLVCQVIVLSPLALHPYVPLPDFPKIVAKMWVVHATATDPVLASNYQVFWGYVPYLGTELGIVPLLGLLDPLVAGRLYLIGALALTGVVPALVHRWFFGRWEPWPLLAYLVVWNHLLFWSFLNFLIAVPFVLLAIAGWVRSEDWHPAARSAAFAPVAFGLMTLHLFAWGAFGLGVLGAQLARRRFVDLVWGGIPFGLSFALWRLLPKPREGHSVFTAMDGPRFRYGTFAERTRDLSAPFNFDWLATDALVICAGGLFVYWLLRSRPVELHPTLKAPLLALCVGVFAMPHIVMGGWGTMRLPVCAALLAVAATRPLPATQPMIGRILAGAAVLFGARMAQIHFEWAHCQAPMHQVRTSLQAIEPGAALASVLAEGNAPQCLRRPVYSHVATYAVIDQSAYSPQLMAFSSVFPTDSREELAALEGPLIPGVLDERRLELIRSEADYLLYMHMGQPMVGADGFEVVDETDWFTLLRVQ